MGVNKQREYIKLLVRLWTYPRFATGHLPLTDRPHQTTPWVFNPVYPERSPRLIEDPVNGARQTATEPSGASTNAQQLKYLLLTRKQQGLGY